MDRKWTAGGPELGHFGPLLDRPEFGPLPVQFGPVSSSVHFSLIPRFGVRNVPVIYLGNSGFRRRNFIDWAILFRMGNLDTLVANVGGWTLITLSWLGAKHCTSFEALYHGTIHHGTGTGTTLRLYTILMVPWYRLVPNCSPPGLNLNSYDP